MAELANVGPDPLTLQIAETLNSQSQAIMQVAQALKDLQASMTSAVTDTFAGPRNDQTVAQQTDLQETVTDTDSEEHAIPVEAWDDIRNAFLASQGLQWLQMLRIATMMPTLKSTSFRKRSRHYKSKSRKLSFQRSPITSKA